MNILKGRLGCRQVVRQRVLIPSFVGSNPATPAKTDKSLEIATFSLFYKHLYWSVYSVFQKALFSALHGLKIQKSLCFQCLTSGIPKNIIPTGERLAMHKHPMLNVGYMIKGELTVYSEKGDVLVLKAGDPIVELVDTWHYGENTGSEDVVIVVTYVGNEEEDLSIPK